MTKNAFMAAGAATLTSLLGCAPIHMQIRGDLPATLTARAQLSGTKRGSMKFYQSEVHYAKVGLTVKVNGITVVTDSGEAGGGGGGMLLNQFLLDETNHLTVTLRSVKGVSVPPAGAFAVVKVNAFGRERTSKPEVVYQHEWQQTTPPTALPTTVTGTLPPVMYAHPLSWQNAPRVAMDAHSEAAISALIKQYHDALDAKDLTQVHALLTTAMQDESVALGRSTSDIEAGQTRQFGEDFSNHSWGMQPVDYAHLQYHACAAGRLISVEKPDGSAPLESKPDENKSVTSYDVRVAFLHGQWTLVT